MLEEFHSILQGFLFLTFCFFEMRYVETIAYSQCKLLYTVKADVICVYPLPLSLNVNLILVVFSTGKKSSAFSTMLCTYSTQIHICACACGGQSRVQSRVFLFRRHASIFTLFNELKSVCYGAYTCGLKRATWGLGCFLPSRSIGDQSHQTWQ